VAETTPTPPPAATDVPPNPRLWLGRYREDHERAGQLIERTHTCECGRAFRQNQLSVSFLEAMEARGTIKLFEQQTPGFWVPVHCGPCERVQLRFRQQVDDARQLGNDRRASA
jgi:hypothetical protein